MQQMVMLKLLQRWRPKLWHRPKLNNKLEEVPLLSSHLKKWHKFKLKLRLKLIKLPQLPQL